MSSTRSPCPALVDKFVADNLLHRKWVDSESYLLYPTAIGVSISIP